MYSQDRSLEGIPESEWKELSKRISEAGGRVLLLVHPFYNSVTDKRYYDTLYALLRKSKIPIITLEEERRIHETNGRFKAFGAKQVFFISTAPGSSEVIVGKKQAVDLRGNTYGYDHYDYGLTVFHDKLKSLGVRHLFIGGQKTHYVEHERWHPLLGHKIPVEKKHLKETIELESKRYPHLRTPPGKTILLGCAGDHYSRALKRLEKVTLIPNLVSPDKPIRKKRSPWLRKLRPK
ncbi:MAG: hypothetical protein PHH82_00745 [Candidatus ainarchaeum sp.]|nr:hypothetical protein [Candidatus ainarchaeum sp.]